MVPVSTRADVARLLAQVASEHTVTECFDTPHHQPEENTMARIKVTAYIDTDDIDTNHVDLTHEMGLTSAGYEEWANTLSSEGLTDTEFVLEPNLFVVTIVETETGEIVKTFDPCSERRANKIEDGASINLDHTRFHTRLAPAPR